MSHDAAHASRMHGEPEEPHGVTVPPPHHHVNYIVCFLTLVALTVATVLAYYVFRTSESELLKILVALAIAAVKAAVVAMFFMHLKFEGKLIYTIAIVPLILCVLLVVALIPDVLRGPLFNNRPVFNPAQSAAGGGDHTDH
ncbi:MAG: cytochrome C oxidase subunit IV family protein [Planctomycetota bacterium]|nr:cytochrome C oxidase subunit IV family protein [Planctomycetota bacterium]